MERAFQRCIDPDCKATFGIQEVHVSCPVCAAKGKQSLLDIEYQWDRMNVPGEFCPV